MKFRAVNRNIFNAIKNGQKKIETRAATTKYHDIKTGDIIVFLCGKSRFKKKVKKAKIHKTISAMLKKHKVRQINPFCNTVKELEKTYLSFPGYGDKIKKHGIIALELK